MGKGVVRMMMGREGAHAGVVLLSDDGQGECQRDARLMIGGPGWC